MGSSVGDLFGVSASGYPLADADLLELRPGESRGLRVLPRMRRAARRPAQPGREVRKTVTVVFCDVTGSTAMGERLDPESLRRVMTRYFDAMRAALERHGGTVEKFIGDAVMAVFGVPRVHEDDALRAVRAAAEMREALAALNKEFERDRGVTLTGADRREHRRGRGRRPGGPDARDRRRRERRRAAGAGGAARRDPDRRRPRSGSCATPSSPSRSSRSS